MNLLNLFELKQNPDSLFGAEKNKTLAEYQRELLIKAGRKQFEKLHDLGLSIPVQLV